MANKPLRQYRLDYVKSDPVAPAEAHLKRRQGNPFALIEDFGDFLEEKLFGSSEKPIYRVELAERQGAEKISWIEKATKRDFKIGVSLGSLAFLSIMAATGGTALVAPGLLIAAGGILGGISDYTRNTKEMEDAAYIQAPGHINRDAVKGALGWGFGIKLALTLGAVGLAAAGAPVFGLGATWAAAAAGGAGIMGQVAAVAQSIPAVIGLGSFAIGAVFGGVRGSEQGYQRMEKEYKAAKIKSERPELGVSIVREFGVPAAELALNVVAPVVTAGLVAGVGSHAARMEQQTMTANSNNPTERHTPALVAAGYPKAIPIAYPNEQQQARIDATTLPEVQPIDTKPVLGKHTEAIMEKRATQPARQPIDLSGLKGVSFTDRYEQRQSESAAMPVAAL